MRISQLDWPQILYARKAAILLGVGALLSIPAVFLIHSGTDPDAFGPILRIALQCLGCAGIFGFFGLSISMGFFWLRCDSSSKLNRTIWFVVLLLGFPYGSQIGYYALVYLPAVLKRLNAPQNDGTVMVHPQPQGGDNRLGPFRRNLLMWWGSSLLPMVTILVLPKTMPWFSEAATVFFLLCSAVVALECVAHLFVWLYRSGMSRPAK